MKKISQIISIGLAATMVALLCACGVTNNSNEYYSSVYGIETYVDDVMVGDYHSHLFNKGNEELYYSGISKGKKVMGYVTAEAYKDSKKVEIVFEEPSLYGNAKKISFVFDIPPVEN